MFTTMPDQFVPLAPPPSLPKETAFASLSLKTHPIATPASSPAKSFESLLVAAPDSGRSPDPACANPVISLQRKGDVVSEIRIQCGCGKVIELTCLH
jgi:hypothetical protein